MIYVSLSTIPQRIKNIDRCVDSILKQTKKPDKIFINIPNKYKRFDQVVDDNQIPKFSDDRVEITRCEDSGPGTKLMGSLNKLRKDSLVILVDDDHFYKDYMIEKFLHFYSKAPNNAYSFYVYPIANFPVAQGADGFAINTNHLKGIKSFYKKVVENYRELFLNDDLWISYFLYFFKKNKIYNLQEHIKKSDEKSSLIYEKHIEASGLIETYGKSLSEAVNKRNEISLESFKYMQEKTKDLVF